MWWEVINMKKEELTDLIKYMFTTITKSMSIDVDCNVLKSSDESNKDYMRIGSVTMHIRVSNK